MGGWVGELSFYPIFLLPKGEWVGGWAILFTYL